MEYIFLAGARLDTPEAAQVYLAKKLNVPPHYGRNLDALYDVLTEPRGEVTLVVYGSARGTYAARVLRVLTDAAAHTPHLTLQWHGDAGDAGNAAF
ncbi:MAG: barstar family protein [Ruthenibacterium sp.]